MNGRNGSALAGRTPSVPLNEKGKEQAQQIAERLKAQPITAVYSSPLLRCLETAQPLAAALDLPVSVEPGILEVDYGEWRTWYRGWMENGCVMRT